MVVDAEGCQSLVTRHWSYFQHCLSLGKSQDFGGLSQAAGLEVELIFMLTIVLVVTKIKLELI